MKQNSTPHPLLHIAFAVLLPFGSLANTYTDNGTNTNYSLYAGDTLKVTEGIYTGNILRLKQGAVIFVYSGATFRPNTMNDIMGVFLNYGVADLPFFNSKNGFRMENHGRTILNFSLLVDNGAQTWNNHFGGTLECSENFELKNGMGLANDGSVSVQGNLQTEAGSEISNRNMITVDGTGNLKGRVANEGFFAIKGLMTFETTASLTNQCRFVSEGGIQNNSNQITNLGLFWVKSMGSGNDRLTNNGTITNTATGVIKSVDFTNNGLVTGAGKLYFTGNTVHTGTIGVSGVTSDTIRVCDMTWPDHSTIFDTETGTVHPNAVYDYFHAPDTTNTVAGCSPTMSAIVLPVLWEYFYAKVVNKVPVLYWSSAQEAGTVFQVQRSVDGTSFVTVQTINATSSTSKYQIADNSLGNDPSGKYFYRIKGIEPSGETSYSPTRIISFSNTAVVTMQAVPNPFVATLKLNYVSERNENLAIRIHNTAGQLLFSKNVRAAKGMNQFDIDCALRLPRGMYLVEMIIDGQTVAATRIVKQ